MDRLTYYRKPKRKFRIKDKFKFYRRISGMVFIASALALLITVTATYFHIKSDIRDGLSNLTIPQDEMVQMFSPSGEKLSPKQNLFACLIIGVDTNEERDQRDAGYNSDTLIVVVTNTETFETTMISVPRDSYAKIPLLNPDGTQRGERYGKINSAFSQGYGMKKYSCENACKAVSDLLGVPIKNYIALNMDAVGPLTDAIGGVTLKIDADFSAYGMPEGSTQTLTGDKALTYVRTRKGVGTGGSDTARTKRQLRFVNAYLKKVKQQNPVSLLVKNYSIINKHTHSNMSYADLYAFAQLATKSNFTKAETHSLSGGWDGTYLQLDKNNLKQVVSQTFFE